MVSGCPNSVTTSKGSAAHVIMCHFCPYTCSNDDYTYQHLAANHLNIQWGCGVCFKFVNGYLSKIWEDMKNHEKRTPKEQTQLSRSQKKNEEEISGSPSGDKVSSDGSLSGSESVGEDDCDFDVSEESASKKVSKDGTDAESD